MTQKSNKMNNQNNNVENDIEKGRAVSANINRIDMNLQNEVFLSNLNQTLDSLNRFVSGASNIMSTYADMKIQISQVEAQVDAFCASLETDLKKYQHRLPIVEKQLNSASERIDRFVDRILDMEGDNTSPEYLQRQSLLLDALTSINNQFNNILVKLL